MEISFNNNSSIFITCPFKASAYTAKEVEDLGYKTTSVKDNAITLEGSLKDCVRLNLSLRTASKVLWLLFSFEARDADELYKEMMDFKWELVIEPNGYFSIQSFTQNDTINNTLFTNLKVKDAIADYFTKKFKQRPDSGPEKTGIVLYIYWIENQVNVYLDTSGDSLARHGYRKIPLRAPLQENLAASIIMASGWKANSHFVNPMCGSGTLAIEAALMMIGKTPGMIKSEFAFRNIKGFSRDMEDEVLKEIEGRMKREVPYRIIASDISAEAISAARVNAKLAGVEDMIDFKTCSFEATPIPGGKGVVFMNPPYGDRIGEDEMLTVLYKGIGDYLKQKCMGYNGYVFTGNPTLAKFIGLKPKRKIPLFNAKIECRLLEFEIYAGSKKDMFD